MINDMAEEAQKLLLKSAKADIKDFDQTELDEIQKVYDKTMETIESGRTVGFVFLRVYEGIDGKVTGDFGIGGAPDTVKAMMEYAETEGMRQMRQLGVCACPTCRLKTMEKLASEEIGAGTTGGAPVQVLGLAELIQALRSLK